MATFAGFWGTAINRLRALPPNAEEWGDVDVFVQEVRRLADEAGRARRPVPTVEPSAASAPVEYEAWAGGDNPALMIFLLDCGAVMAEAFTGASRTAAASHLLELIAGQMVVRSTRGMNVSPCYDVVLMGYADTDFEVLPRISIDRLAEVGVPVFELEGPSNAAAAFRRALALLQAEPQRSARYPAPMVVHITAGEFTGDDPEPITNEIMALRTGDGPVLIENVLVADGLAPAGVTAETWSGIASEAEVDDPKLRKLFRMSSPLPKTFRGRIEMELGVSLSEYARMLFPYSLPEFAELCLPERQLDGIGRRRSW